jgi:hypothetical protein
VSNLYLVEIKFNLSILYVTYERELFHPHIVLWWDASYKNYMLYSIVSSHGVNSNCYSIKYSYILLILNIIVQFLGLQWETIDQLEPASCPMSHGLPSRARQSARRRSTFLFFFVWLIAWCPYPPVQLHLTAHTQYCASSLNDRRGNTSSSSF